VSGRPGHAVRGHVMFDGRRFPVTSVRLADGAIRITWEASGPYAGATAPVTVFGEDGKGIAQVGEACVPPLPENAVIALTHLWTIGGVTDL
jgi:hypothetical protein